MRLAYGINVSDSSFMVTCNILNWSADIMITITYIYIQAAFSIAELNVLFTFSSVICTIIYSYYMY